MSGFIKLKCSRDTYVNIDHISQFYADGRGTTILMHDRPSYEQSEYSKETAKEFYERLKEIKAFGKPLEDVGDIQNETERK